MGPDFRVLVRKSRKQAEQYHRLYKVQYIILHCYILPFLPIFGQYASVIMLSITFTLEFKIGMNFFV